MVKNWTSWEFFKNCLYNCLLNNTLPLSKNGNCTQNSLKICLKLINSLLNDRLDTNDMALQFIPCERSKQGRYKFQSDCVWVCMGLQWCLKVHLYVTYLLLDQACTTYGPRAKCGPRKHLIWPSHSRFLFFHLVYLTETPFERVKHIIFGPYTLEKEIFGPPRE